MSHNDDRYHDVELQGVNTTKQRRRPQWVGAVIAIAAAVLMMGLVAACGDEEDEEASSEEAFCAAGDSLENNIAGLSDIDIIAGGTNALDAQFDAIKSDVEDLRTSGGEVAADEIAALEAAVDQLEADLGALGDDVTAEGAGTVGDSVNSVVTAAQAVNDRLDATCP